MRWLPVLVDVSELNVGWDREGKVVDLVVLECVSDFQTRVDSTQKDSPALVEVMREDVEASRR